MLGAYRRRARWKIDDVEAVDDARPQGRLQPTAHQFRYRFTDGDFPGFSVCLYFPKNIIQLAAANRLSRFDHVSPFRLSLRAPPSPVWR